MKNASKLMVLNHLLYKIWGRFKIFQKYSRPEKGKGNKMMIQPT